MPACSNLEIWNPLPPGSQFCASASGTNNDFFVGVRLVGADGSETQFFKSDLVPGPASRSLSQQGYAARLTLLPGGSAPTVTMNAWIEDGDGKRLFECTWTAAAANKVRRVTVVMIPQVA